MLQKPKHSFCLPAKGLLFLLLAVCTTTYGFGQNGVAINTTGALANNSAMLDISSTTAGMLMPRMTSVQKNAISSPATGLLIYQTDAPAGFYYYNGSSWAQLSAAILGQNATTVYGAGVLNRTPAQTSFALIPGLATSITIPSAGTYYVYVATDGGIQTQSVLPDGFSACDVAIVIDGSIVSNGGYKRLTAVNNPGIGGNFSFWSMSLFTSLSAGTHTIALHGASAGLTAQSGTTIGGNDLSVLQPALTTLLIKQ